MDRVEGRIPNTDIALDCLVRVVHTFNFDESPLGKEDAFYSLKLLRTELKRLREIEWMYEGLCK